MERRLELVFEKYEKPINLKITFAYNIAGNCYMSFERKDDDREFPDEEFYDLDSDDMFAIINFLQMYKK